MTNHLRTIRAFLLGFVHNHGDAIASLLTFAAALTAYFNTMAPSVATVFDDSLELQLVAFQPGIAHPTGYPLYTLLGKLFTFIPLGDVAYRVNLMSVMSGALACFLVYWVCRRLASRRLPALGASLLLAFSPALWSQATVAEVYTLNAVFVAGLLLLALYVRHYPSPRSLVFLATVSGLALTHHRTIVLLFPAMAVYLWLAIRDQVRLNVAAALRLAPAFAAPLLLYAYIPIRGMVMSSVDGTYVNSPAGFISWVLASGYGSFFADNPLARDTGTLTYVLTSLVEQFGYLGLALAVLGFAWTAIRDRRDAVLIGGALLSYVAFVLSYRVSDIQVFYLPVYVICAVMIGVGLSALWHWADRHVRSEPAPKGALRLVLPAVSKTVAVACLVASLALPADALRQNYASHDMRQDFTAYEYAQDILRQPLEEGATVIGLLGETTLLRYFQETTAARTDLKLSPADREEDRLGAIARGLASGSPVYLTRPLPGVESRYSLASFGPLVKVMPEAITESPSIRFPRVVDFSGQTMLLGYSINEPPSPEPLARPRTTSSRAALRQDEPGGVESGRRVGITLYWKSLRRLTEDYHISLRLLDDTGRVLAQQDGMPVQDAYPTSGWRPGEIIIDTHYLRVPLGTVPGDYALAIALYSASTPDGVKAYDGAKLESIVTVGELRVARPLSPISPDTLPAKSMLPSVQPSLPGWAGTESLASLGVPNVVQGNFDNQITLYAYGVSRLPLVPGEGADINLLWKAERDLDTSYVVFLQLVGPDGKIWASRDTVPASGAYPTSTWKRSELVRDIHAFLLPANMPNGEYRLEAGLYRSSDSARLTLLRWTQRSTDVLELGTVTVKGRDRVFTTPAPAWSQPVRFGSGIGLLGYDIARQDTAGVPPTFKLTLYFQALQSMDRSYTAFTHLLDSQNRIWAQQDNTPLKGKAATTTWLPGESITDEYLLAVKPGAPPGDYVFEVGFYDAVTNARLPLYSPSGASLGDRLILSEKVVLAP
jgi:hypothetical protein